MIEAHIDLSTLELNAVPLMSDIYVSRKMQPGGRGNEAMCVRKMYTNAGMFTYALWLVKYLKPLDGATVFFPHAFGTAVGKGEWNDTWLGEDGPTEKLSVSGGRTDSYF